MDYGFTINVNGNSVQEMKRIEGELTRLGIQSSTVTRQVEGSFDRMGRTAEDLGRKLVAAFAVERIFEFGKKILETTALFEGFDNRIKFASLSTYDAHRNMSFLADEVTRLHIPMEKANEGFSEMQAGLVGTGIEGKRLRDLFDGISTAAATLHLPEYQLQRTLYDLKEIGEIGLNKRIERSLSTALPGINKIVQDTFGKTFDELQKDHISGGEFLARLGPALTQHFQSGLENFGNSLQAKMADLDNTFTKFMLNMGDKLRPVFSGILGGLTNFLNSGFIQLFTENIAGLVHAVTTLALTWGVYKIAVIGSEMAMKAYAATVEAVEIVQAGLNGQMTVSEILFQTLGPAIETAGLAIAAFSLVYIIQGFIDLNKQVEDSLEKITHFKELTGQFSANQTRTEDLRSQFASSAGFTGQEKGELLSDVSGTIAKITSDLDRKFVPGLTHASEALEQYKASHPHLKGNALENQTEEWVGQIKQFTEKIDQSKSQLFGLKNIEKALTAQGVKPFIGGPLTGGVGGKLHSSHLSGAEGGLNQARIVNLKIDTVMKVTTTDNKNLVKHAETAVNYVLRAVNNLSESQSGTM